MKVAAIVVVLVVSSVYSFASNMTRSDVAELFDVEVADVEVKRGGVLHNLELSKVPSLPVKKIPLIRARKRSDKYLFIKSIASVMNYVNYKIIEQRAILEKKRHAFNLSPREKRMLSKMYKFYHSRNINELLIRVAPIPVSLAVAQAALESCFGSDKNISGMNAYFGLVRDPIHLLRFDTLLESAIYYSKTLNVNDAYRSFRKNRIRMIFNNERISGKQLVTSLNKYSSNHRYVELVAKIIKDYDLNDLDKNISYSLLRAAHKSIIKKHARFITE